MHVLKEIHIYIIIIILIFTFRHEQTSCCQHWKKHITTVNLVMMTPSRILKLQSYIMKVFIFFNKKVLMSSKRNSEVYSHSVPVVSLELNMLVFAGQQQVRTMAAGSVTPVFIVFGQVLYWHLSRNFFNVNTQLRSDLLGVVDCKKGNDLLYGPRLSEGSKDFLENLDHVLMTDIYKVHHSLQISSCYPLIFNQITFNDPRSFLKGVFVDSVRTCACLSLSPAYIK